jgi:hypothetical protein
VVTYLLVKCGEDNGCELEIRRTSDTTCSNEIRH